MKTKLLVPLVAGLCAINLARAEKLRALADAGPAPDAKHEHRFFFRQFDDGEKETVAFLGVETDTAPAVLASQLDLPRGTGLVVHHVVPDSPAASTLQVDDVLLKLDDQLLIDPHQLAVLIRNHKEGDEVTLTYLRGGKEATVKVKLAKHDVPKVAWIESPPIHDGDFEFRRLNPGEKMGGDPEAMDRVLSLLDQRGAEGMAERGAHRVVIEGPRGPGLHALSVNPGNSNIVYSDDKGSLELTIKEGKKSLVAKNPKGEQVFSGPIDTPEQRKALPPEVRERLEQIEGMDNFSFKTGAGFQDDVRILRQARDIALPLPPPLHEPAEQPPAF
ncbi:MAG TPA: PDZ domain-containing protein [Opitutus sp.]|nr:PDZ domain-containing protein [Opitutus sp.]